MGFFLDGIAKSVSINSPFNFKIRVVKRNNESGMKYSKKYLVAIYRNFNVNSNFLFALLSKGVIALAKCENFKRGFQTKYSSYQHETNASNSGRT